jgi:hypothetical protein
MTQFVTALAAGVAAAAAVMVLAIPSGTTGGAGAAWAATGETTMGGQGCDHDGLTTKLVPVFEPAAGYVVVAVEVSGIDPRCGGHQMSVALTDGSGTVSSQGGPMVVPFGGGAVQVPVAPLAVASAVKVHTLLD